MGDDREGDGVERVSKAPTDGQMVVRSGSCKGAAKASAVNFRVLTHK